MRVLYVGMRADYGDISRGLSFEERNFHHPLRHLPGVTVEHFDFMELGKRHGQGGMSQMLRDRILGTGGRRRPDLLFLVPFDEHSDPAREVIQEITEHSGTATMVWICDDHWRYENYSRHWASCVDWIVTTDANSLPKYQADGLGDRVLLSQWAVNHRLYRPTWEDRDLAVSFVGQPHGDRHETIARLRGRGVPLEVFGFGWGEQGPRLPFHEMIRVFSRSRINLNLGNSSCQPVPQIKGRNFEVPGCKGLLLTPVVPHLESYFEPDREVLVFRDEDELVDKVRFYLEREDLRRQVATRGYARCLREHTWDHRFRALFEAIGLPQGTAKRPRAVGLEGSR